MRQAAHGLAALREPMSGALSVVAAGTPGTYVLPEIVAAFQQVHPGVRMQFELATSAQVVNAVRSHRAEVGVIAVRRGHGIAAFSRLALSEELTAGTLVVIPFVPWRVRRTFSIVRIRDGALTPPAQRLLAMLRVRCRPLPPRQRNPGRMTASRKS